MATRLSLACDCSDGGMPLTVRTFMVALIIASLLPRSVMSAQQRFAQDQPDVSGDSDGRHAWMTAVYRDLIVRKLTNPTRGTVSIDSRHRLDALTIWVRADGSIAIRRGKQAVTVDSAESLAIARSVLDGSESVEQLLALAHRMVTRRSVSDAALLTTIAFVRTVVSDTGSPVESMRQLFTDRAWLRSNKRDRCAMAYAARNTALLDSVEVCIGDGESGNSWIACHSQWFAETEASWFDYLTCSWPVMQR